MRELTDDEMTTVFASVDAGESFFDIAKKIGGVKAGEVQAFYEETMAHLDEPEEAPEGADIRSDDDGPFSHLDERTPEPVREPKSPPALSNPRRTSAGLRDTLFTAMENLIAGDMKPNEAKALCGLADTICKTVKMEMDAEKMRRAGQMEDGLTHLKLGSDG